MMVDRAAKGHLLGLLPPGKPCHFSQMHSNQRNCFSLCKPRDPQTTLPDPGSPPSFPTETPLSTPAILAIVQTSETSDSVLSYLQKLAVFNLSPFPSQWFGGRIFLVKFLHTLSLFFFFSHSSLHHQSTLSIRAPTALLTHKSTLCSSYLQ